MAMYHACFPTQSGRFPVRSSMLSLVCLGCSLSLPPSTTKHSPKLLARCCGGLTLSENTMKSPTNVPEISFPDKGPSDSLIGVEVVMLLVYPVLIAHGSLTQRRSLLCQEVSAPCVFSFTAQPLGQLVPMHDTQLFLDDHNTHSLFLSQLLGFFLVPCCCALFQFADERKDSF